MKRILALILVVFLCGVIVSGCSDDTDYREDDSWEDKQWDEMDYDEQEEFREELQEYIEDSWY